VVDPAVVPLAPTQKGVFACSEGIVPPISVQNSLSLEPWPQGYAQMCEPFRVAKLSISRQSLLLEIDLPAVLCTMTGVHG
jgi:hypothetical protein